MLGGFYAEVRGIDCNPLEIRQCCDNGVTNSLTKIAKMNNEAEIMFCEFK